MGADMIYAVAVLVVSLCLATGVACYVFGAERARIRAAEEHRKRRAARFIFGVNNAEQPQVIYESADGEVRLFWQTWDNSIRLMLSMPAEPPRVRTLHFSELVDLQNGALRFIQTGQDMHRKRLDMPRKERGERNDFPPWKPN